MNLSYLVQMSVNGPWIKARGYADSAQWFDIEGIGPRHRTEIVRLKLA